MPYFNYIRFFNMRYSFDYDSFDLCDIPNFYISRSDLCLMNLMLISLQSTSLRTKYTRNVLNLPKLG